MGEHPSIFSYIAVQLANHWVLIPVSQSSPKDNTIGDSKASLHERVCLSHDPEDPKAIFVLVLTSLRCEVKRNTV